MLRGLAAIGVASHHTLNESNNAIGSFSPDWLMWAGAAGVDIFFVISGFVMIISSFSRGTPPTPLAFLGRRAVRIYPMYWVCCVVMIVILSAGLLSNKEREWLEFLRSLFLIPSEYFILDLSWTLTYEMKFYFIFAICLLAGFKERVFFCASVAIVALTVLSWSEHIGFRSVFYLAPIALEFCFGMLLAVIWLKYGAHIGSRAGRIILFSGAVAVICTSTVFSLDEEGIEDIGIQRVIWWGLPSVAILISMLQCQRGKSLARRALEFFGDASYSIYLTHAFVLVGYGWIIRHTGVGSWNQSIVVLPVAIIWLLVGSGSYLILERRIASYFKSVGVVRAPYASRIEDA